MPLPDRRTLLLGLAALLLLAAAVTFVRGREGDARPPVPVSAEAADDGAGGVVAAGEDPVLVHVVGAVRRPGVYTLQDGDRVVDALERAGGMTAKGNAVALNLAALLVDGQQVLVPELVPIGAVGGPDVATGTSGLVRLNTADMSALEELPGIGPATAQRILDWRSDNGGFAVVEDLLDVPGIGPAKLDQLRDLVAP